TDLREPHMRAPLRVYVQSDAATSELRLAKGDEHTRQAFADHHLIVTYGENYGAADCGVPTNGVRYLKTRQPVDLELWPAAYTPEARFFSTIGNYRQAGNDVEYQGDVYRWSKHHEWEKVIDLPRHAQQGFELALGLDDDRDRDLLEIHGWGLRQPLPMSLDVFGAYPEFIRGSRAEFTVAKDQNVRLRSGWFSDRDACYLASGKPVVAQDTGFTNVLPTGRGLFALAVRRKRFRRSRPSMRTIRPSVWPRGGSPRSTSRPGRLPSASFGAWALAEPIRLVVNADDFGASRGINEGIAICHRHGVVTSAS